MALYKSVYYYYYYTVAEFAVVVLGDVDMVIDNMVIVAVLTVVFAVNVIIFLVTRIVVYLMVLVDEPSADHF